MTRSEFAHAVDCEWTDVEFGSWSFEELRSIQLPFGMGIERDLLFTGDVPISVWADAAREAGGIREAERLLYARIRDAEKSSGNP